MSHQPRMQWPADEPPPDFADRMVSRLLVVDLPVRRPDRSRMRWVVVLAAAAVLAASSAWAMIEHARRATLAPVVPPAEPPAAEAPVQATPQPQEAPALAATDPAPSSEKAPGPALIPPRSHPAPSASAPAPQASSSAKHIVVPRCECGRGSTMCSCLE